MTKNRNFTLILDPTTAAHIEELTHYFGSSVGRFIVKLDA